MPRLYDGDSYNSYKLFGPFAGNTINGTVAAAAAIKTLKVPANTNGEVTGITAVVTTGGTVGSAKALAIAVGRSLAGTGAVELCGTLTLGSVVADGTAYTANCTGGTFIAGDVLSIRTAATLTAAYAPVVDFMLEYKERYV